MPNLSYNRIKYPIGHIALWSIWGLATEQAGSNTDASSAAATADEPRFLSLLRELLQKKPDLSEAIARRLIEEKKARVGAGYLTSQGAIFLVASDLGITLSHKEATRMGLADLVPGQSVEAIFARILTVGPPKRFVRKNDYTTGLYSKAVLYDDTACVVATLWNEAARRALHDERFKPGNSIKISATIARQGLDNTPSLSVDEGSNLYVTSADEQRNIHIPHLEDRVLGPGGVNRMQKSNLAVRGKVSGPSSKREFARSDRERGSLLSFGLSDESGTLRVVIWQNSNPVFQELEGGDIVTLLNVKSRLSSFGGNESIELHGDESTVILEKWEATRLWYDSLMGDETLMQKASGRPTVSGQIMKSAGIIPFVARVLSLTEDGPESAHALLTDAQGRKISVAISGGALRNLNELPLDCVIICRPNSFDQIALKASCSNDDSMKRVKSKRDDIPSVSQLTRKIGELKAGSIVSVEVMSMSQSSSREITTKEGLVRRTELSVADPSGEIKVYAWRNLSKRLDGIPVGTKMWLRAVEVQNYEGRTFLVLKNYSLVEREG